MRARRALSAGKPVTGSRSASSVSIFAFAWSHPWGMAITSGEYLVSVLRLKLYFAPPCFDDYDFPVLDVQVSGSLGVDLDRAVPENGS